MHTATPTPTPGAAPPPRPAQRLERLAESQTLALAKRVREMRAAGKDVISLTLGEPDFDTPEPIRAAAIQAIREGFTHYPPVAGIAELREACAAKFRGNGIPSTAQQVVVSTGAKQSVVNALMALVDPGEEVLLVAPYWVSYLPMVRMADGVPVVVPTRAEDGLKLTPELLEAHITPRTRMLVLNSPANPHGAMYTETELRALAAVLTRHPQVYVLSDEIYEHIAYEVPHFSIGSLPELQARTVTVNGVSKSFAMTGWRIGFATAPQWIAELCERFQGQITSGANSIAQKAALAALTQDLGPTHHMVAAFRARRDLLVAELRRAVPQWRFEVPDGAFYLYPDVSADFGRRSPDGQVVDTADAYADYLLTAGLVSVVPGTAFGTAQHVRLSYACSEDDIRTAVARIGEALQRLR